MIALPLGTQVGAECPNWARSELCGGRSAMGVPTANATLNSGRRCGKASAASADRKAAHVLSAFAVDHQIILAHEVVDEKSNEIPAVQTLIATLGLSGRGDRVDVVD